MTSRSNLVQSILGRLVLLSGLALAGCGDDTSTPTAAAECDTDENPCNRTQVCEGGKCVRAPRCAEDGTCPEEDADGDALYCEFGYCVEACQDGPRWCSEGTRCDPVKHICVQEIVRFCEVHTDCPDDQVCRDVVDSITEETNKECRPGKRCATHANCDDPAYGAVCHPDLLFCVQCATSEDCTEEGKPICDLVSFRCVAAPPELECTADIECLAEDCDTSLMTCDTEAKRCREAPGGRCLSDCDCKQTQGRYCFIQPELDDQEGACRTKCGSMWGGLCPRGYECGPDDTCVRPGCTKDEDCEELGPLYRCLDDRCVEDQCEEDTDCPNADHGGWCDRVGGESGFGICRDGECLEQGQADTCLDGRVCDVDPFAGLNRIHCQDPCMDRQPPPCPQNFFCDVEGGTGLCIGGVTGGCMTAEMCDDDEICDRERAMPACDDAWPGACRRDLDCPGEEACVDDRCVPADQRPTICTADEECPGRQVCNLAGACELAAPCAADADCPGNLLCDPVNGRCNECTEDADCLVADNGVVCGDSPSGRYLACHEPTNGFCEDDGDCVSTRTCTMGFCEPADCGEDWMDRAWAEAADPLVPDPRGNHVPLYAAPVDARVLTGLRLCDGRDDWFKVALEQGQDLEAIISWDVNDPATPDLGLELRRGNELLSRSNGIGGSERVGLNGAPATDDYLLHVYGDQGVNVEYQLAVTVGEICVDDPFEGPQDNDELARAQQIEPGLIPNLLLCAEGSGGSTADWYSLELEEGTDVLLQIEWDDNDGALTGQVVDGERNVVGDQTEGGGWLHFEITDWQGGRLYLNLSADPSNDAELRYAIRVLAACSDSLKARLCEEASDLPLVPGPLGPNGFPLDFSAQIQGDLALDPGLQNCWSGSCDPLQDVHVAREKVWRLDTTGQAFEGLSVDMRIRYDTDDPDFEAVVYVRGDCVDDAFETSCRLSPRNPYEVKALPPGVYYIVVDGRGESAGPFDVTIQVIKSDVRPNECDSCLNGCVLGDAEHPVLAEAAWRDMGNDRLQAQLRHFTNNAEPNDRGLGACMVQVDGANRGPDTVYEVTTDRPCRFSARLQPNGFIGGLVLREGCPAEVETACRFSNDFAPKLLFVDNLPAGTYTLWVKGSGALQYGDFVLDLECTPPDQPVGGDDCADPIQVEMEDLLDRRGNPLGHEATIIGQNIGAEDTLQMGAACNADVGPVGADKVYAFTLENQPNALFIEMEADYDAVMTLARGDCTQDGIEVEVACGTPAQPIEMIGPDAPPPNDYFLIIDAVDDEHRGGHNVSITSMEVVGDRPSNDACDEPIGAEAFHFEVGAIRQEDGTTQFASHDYSPRACGAADAEAPDVVYTYTAEEDHTLEVTIFGSFQHNVYVRSDDCEDGPEELCAEGDLAESPLPAGTYYVFVDGLRGAADSGAFTIQIGWGPPLGDPPENLDCQTAAPIALVDGRATMLGTTAFADDAFAPPADCGVEGEEGRDVAYYFDLLDPATVTITLDSPFSPVLSVRRADDGDACEDAVTLFCSDAHPAQIAPVDPLAAGRYYVVVDMEFELADAGRFELMVDTVPVEDPPRNDTCDLVEDHFAAWRAGGAALPEDCEGALEVCGLLDPFLEDDGHALIAGTTHAANPTNTIRPHGEEGACPESPLRDTEGARDVVYAFTVERPSEFSAVLRQRGIDNALISLRGPDTCDDVNAERWCMDEPPAIEVERLLPGLWFLIVDGFNDIQVGDFELEILLEALPERPDNDACPADPADAVLIELADQGGDPARSTGEFRVALAGAHDDYAPVACADGSEGGPDVVFGLDLPYASNNLLIDIEAAPMELGADPNYQPDLVAYLRSADPSCAEAPEVPGGCNDDGDFRVFDPSIDLHFDNGQNLPGGRYYLIVDGYGEDDAARVVDVRVAAEEVPVQVAVGDDCDAVDVPELDFGEGGPEVQVLVWESDALGTTWAEDDTASEACPPGEVGGRDTVHKLVLDDEYQVQARLITNGWAGTLSVRSDCDDVGTEGQGCGNSTGLVTLQAGEYSLWVDGVTPLDWGSYRLEVTREPVLRQPCNDVCADAADAHCPDGYGPEPLEFEDDVVILAGQLHELVEDDEDGTCGGIGGKDLVYAVELESDGIVSAWISFSTFRPRLYLRRACGDRGSEIVCGEESFFTERLDAGTYYLVVDGRGAGEDGAFTMVVTRDEAPPNDTCAAPRVLHLGADGVRTENGTTSVANADYQVADCGGAPAGAGARDVVYQFEVASTSTARIALDANFDGVVYLTRGACDPADGQAVVLGCAADQIEVEDLQRDETYWIHVDGVGAGDEGGFLFRLEVESVAPFNDQCPGATELGTLGGRTLRAESVGRSSGAVDDTDDCGDHGGPDVYYAFNVGGRSRDAEVYLEFDAPADAFDHHLSVQQARGDDGCEGPPVGECSSLNDKLLLPDLDVDSYILVVDGVTPDDAGAFTLVAATPTPSNSSCAQADDRRVLLEAEGNRTFTGSLTGATKEYSTDADNCDVVATGQGRDVVYRFDTEVALEYIDFQVDSDHFESVAWVTKTSCRGANAKPECWAGEVAHRLERPGPGRYYVIVDGNGPDALGDFELTVTTGEVLPGPANQTCATPEEVPLVWGVPEVGEATTTVQGYTLSSSNDYDPACSDQPRPGGEEPPPTGPDVVYCILVDTERAEVVVTVTAEVPDGAGDWQPSLYLHKDPTPPEPTAEICTHDAVDGDCPGGEDCCQQDGYLCETGRCLKPPSCGDDDLDPDECTSGNSIGCRQMAFFALSGSSPRIQKFYAVVDGNQATDEGDFDLKVSVQKMTCAVNDDCPAGEVCDPGFDRCVPTCDDNTDCSEGYTCADPVDMPPQRCIECEADDDCEADERPYCDNGACAACRDDDDCDGDTPHCAHGSCAPCATDADCAGDDICNAAAVCGACSENWDCPVGQVCEMEEGTCGAMPGM